MDVEKLDLNILSGYGSTFRGFSGSQIKLSVFSLLYTFFGVQYSIHFLVQDSKSRFEFPFQNDQISAYQAGKLLRFPTFTRFSDSSQISIRTHREKNTVCVSPGACANNSVITCNDCIEVLKFSKNGKFTFEWQTLFSSFLKKIL